MTYTFNSSADIILTIDPSTNVVSLVIDSSDLVSSEVIGGGLFHRLDFGNLAGADANYGNIAATFSQTSGTGAWGDLTPPNGLFQIATSNNLPVYLHIESRRVGLTPLTGVSNWAGSLEATYAGGSTAFASLTPGSYTLTVSAGSATDDVTINVIPEPGCVALLLSSIPILCISRRRFIHHIA
jgi:hypothetical protein